MAAAAGLAAANPEYRAGTAASGSALALALEDRRGRVVLIAQAEFAVTRAYSDLVAAQTIKTYALERGGILLRGAVGAHSPTAGEQQDVMAAIAAALGQREPARILYDGAAIAVTTPEGRCLAALSAAAELAFEGCGAGEPARGPIRSAFQMFEPAHGLLQRSAPLAGYPVGAIALGDRVAILALGGPTPPAIRGKGLMVAGSSNDDVAPPDDPRMRAAIRSVLARVGRR
jgi:hypothetical protein